MKRQPWILCLFAVILSGLAVFLLTALFSPARAATQGWTLQSQGLGGVSVLALGVHPQTTTTLYAGTETGVYVSTDGGSHWSDTTNDLRTDQGDVPPINALVIQPGAAITLYVGSNAGGGIFKSINGGQNWQAVNNGLTTRYVQTLAINPSNPQILYAGTVGGGVFKSVNGGLSWSPANTNLPQSANVSSIVLDPGNADILYAGVYGNGIYQSTDAGASWTRVYFGSSVNFNQTLLLDPNSSSTLYVGTNDLGLFKSMNSGTTFTAKNQGLTRSDVTALWLQNSTTLYAGTDDGGVFKTTDAGEHWTPVNIGCQSSYIQVLTGIPATSVLYVGTKGGICKSTNGGAAWSPANVGLPAAQTEALLLLPSQPITLYAGTSGGGVYAWQNGEWLSKNAGITNTWIRSLARDPISPTHLYAGTYFGGIYKSLDSGATWSNYSTGLPGTGAKSSDVHEIVVNPITHSVVYAAVVGGLYKSIDAGAHWANATNGMPFTADDILALAIDSANPQVLYAGTVWDGIYKTLDGGQNWLPVGQMAGPVIRELAVDPHTSAIVYSGTDGMLYRSANGGDSWAATNLTRTVTTIAFNPVITTTLYAGTEGWGVYVSDDNGLTWQALTRDGLPEGKAYVYDLEVDILTQNLYAAMMNGAESATHASQTVAEGREIPFTYPESRNLQEPTLVRKSYGIYALSIYVPPPTKMVYLPLVIR